MSTTVTTRAAIFRGHDAPQEIAAGARVELDPTELVAREKTITGSYYGSSNPVESLGRLLDLVADGSLLLAPLLGSCYPLERIDEAVAEAQSAAGGRVLLIPD